MQQIHANLGTISTFQNTKRTQRNRHKDGPIFPIYASNIDIQRSLEFSLKWENKLLICSSKRISESTLFLEYLMHPNSESALDFYFQNQQVTKSIIGKLPADYLLLQKILKPGQRTPSGGFSTQPESNTGKESRFNPNLHILHEEAKSSYHNTFRIPKEISRGRVQNRTKFRHFMCCMATRIGNKSPPHSGVCRHAMPIAIRGECLER